MDRLNYHHLLYFFTVAREGSVARASAKLGLKQPTVSAQIHALEGRLGRRLLERSGRGLKVTPEGETVLRYAAGIFTLGDELLSALNGSAQTAPELTVGAAVSLPPSLVATLLEAVFALKPRPRLKITEAATDVLAAQLAARSLHFALTDEAPGKGMVSGLYSRVVLESVLEMFAPATLARKVSREFPANLKGVPVLMPARGTIRRGVDRWLKSRHPAVVELGEMPDPEMHATSAGAAIFAPRLLREFLKESYGLRPVGELEGSCYRVFLLTNRHAVTPPAAAAVVDAVKGLR